jgi:hypothetical protein
MIYLFDDLLKSIAIIITILVVIHTRSYISAIKYVITAAWTQIRGWELSGISRKTAVACAIVYKLSCCITMLAAFFRLSR